MDLSVGAWVGIGCAAATLLVILSHICCNRKFMHVRGKVVAITGGSSGIGKAVAQRVLERGGRVALLARREAVLESAKEELAAAVSGSRDRITVHASDVTSEEAMVTAMAAVVEEHGGLDVVVACAGTSNPARFEDISEGDWEWLLKLNVTGVRNSVFAALPYLKQSPVSRVCIISSAAGLLGVYGFTAYSATKFAVIGMAQALHQELRPFGTSVTVHVPPDTETPLLKRENETKPPLTAIISESGGLFSASAVAKDIVAGVENGDFLVGTGFDLFMLTTATQGMAPARSVWQGLYQALLAGPMRLVALFYQTYWAYQIDSYARKHPTEFQGDVTGAGEKKDS